MKELVNFYEALRQDDFITSTHISIYMALFKTWNEQGFQNPVTITRKEIMKSAKVRGPATYHKCIKQLEASGYIRYVPSCNPAVLSQVWMIRLKTKSAAATRLERLDLHQKNK